jgi:hypothetical protein
MKVCQLAVRTAHGNWRPQGPRSKTGRNQLALKTSKKKKTTLPNLPAAKLLKSSRNPASTAAAPLVGLRLHFSADSAGWIVTQSPSTQMKTARSGAAAGARAIRLRPLQ